MESDGLRNTNRWDSEESNSMSCKVRMKGKRGKGRRREEEGKKKERRRGEEEGEKKKGRLGMKEGRMDR